MEKIEALYMVQLITGSGAFEKVSSAYFSTFIEALHFYDILKGQNYYVKAFKHNGDQYMELES